MLAINATDGMSTITLPNGQQINTPPGHVSEAFSMTTDGIRGLVTSYKCNEIGLIPQSELEMDQLASVSAAKDHVVDTDEKDPGKLVLLVKAKSTFGEAQLSEIESDVVDTLGGSSEVSNLTDESNTVVTPPAEQEVEPSPKITDAEVEELKQTLGKTTEVTDSEIDAALELLNWAPKFKGSSIFRLKAEGYTIK